MVFSPILAFFQMRLCVLYDKYSLGQQKLCGVTLGRVHCLAQCRRTKWDGQWEGLSKQWQKKNLGDFCLGWCSEFGQGVLPEWSVSKESQEKLVAATSGTELLSYCWWRRVAVWEWLAEMQKSSAKTEGDVALMGNWEVAVFLVTWSLMTKVVPAWLS